MIAEIIDLYGRLVLLFTNQYSARRVTAAATPCHHLPPPATLPRRGCVCGSSSSRKQVAGSSAAQMYTAGGTRPGRRGCACAWPPGGPARRGGRTRAVSITTVITMIYILYPALACAHAARAASNASHAHAHTHAARAASNASHAHAHTHAARTASNASHAQAHAARTASNASHAHAHDHRRGYDSDFDSFMSKMFSQMPQGTATIAQEKLGPNMGYRPYWYGYSFMLGQLSPQPLPLGGTTQDWDYGLDGASGRDIWGGNQKVLLGGDHGLLGQGAAFFDDGDKVGGVRRPSAEPNKGPTGDLGIPPNEFSAATLKTIEQRTWRCSQCSIEDEAIGPVCVVDKNSNVMEMDRCAFLNANCNQGTAFVKASYESQFLYNTFAVTDEWIHFSVKADNGKCFIVISRDMQTALPMGSIFPNYMFELDPAYNHYSTYFDKNKAAVITYYKERAVVPDNFTEYSIVWNGDTGWILLSQPRTDDYTQHVHIEWVDPEPFEIKYITVTSMYSQASQWILHDLPKDLVLLNNGPCSLGAVPEEPEDTRELIAKTNDREKEFKDRMNGLQDKGVDVNGSHWQAQEGSEAEY